MIINDVNSPAICRHSPFNWKQFRTHPQNVPARSTLTNSRCELTIRRYFSRNDLTPNDIELPAAVSLVSRIRLLTYKKQLNRWIFYMLSTSGSQLRAACSYNSCENTNRLSVIGNAYKPSLFNPFDVPNCCCSMRSAP